MSRSRNLGAPGQQSYSQGDPATRPSIYQRLDPDEREIRILCLLPSRRFQSPIQCELYTVSLDDARQYQYEALSYVWGDPGVCRGIQVNGHTIAVTTNLEAALRRLRGDSHYRNLWVDALCINQRDNVEKSQQVNLMRHIYASTAHAILWLGDHTELEQPDSAVELHDPPPPDPPNTLPRKKVELAFELLDLMEADSHYLSHGEARDQIWDERVVDALESLMQLPWWSRIWTVQEAMLPKQATVVCGTYELPLKNFFTASLNCLYHFEDGCCVGDDGIQPFPMFVTTAQTMRLLQSPMYNSITFAYALKAFRSRKASDPRDYIFGLLGLGGRMPADYSLPHRAVFLRSVRRLIAETNSLFPILRNYEINRDPTLPTWVPDWCAESDKPYKSFDMAWLYQYRYYNAAGRATPQIREASSETILELSGFEVDEVEVVGDCCGSGEPDDAQVIDQWQEMIGPYYHSRDGIYPSGGTYEEAFWRMMAVDMVLFKDEATGAMGVRRARPEDEESCRRKWDSGDESSSEVLQIAEKKFFITRRGLIGVSNRDVSIGDAIFVLLGGQMPFVLRLSELRDEERPCHEYCGEAYVHGIMDGQVMKEGRDPKWVRLV